MIVLNVLELIYEGLIYMHGALALMLSDMFIKLCHSGILLVGGGLTSIYK